MLRVVKPLDENKINYHTPSVLTVEFQASVDKDIFEEKQLSSGRHEKSVAVMYNEEDLSKCALFAGKFINFGYYIGDLAKPITITERVESQKNLYRLIAQALSITHEDNILEVGAGLGVGAALVFKEFSPKALTGIDFSTAQVGRATKINHKELEAGSGKLKYSFGSASEIPHEDKTFSKVYSIEAAQHFPDIAQFFKEGHRVLNDDGTLCIATFFGTDESSTQNMGGLVQTIRDGIDHIPSIDKVESDLKQAGFQKVRITAIGSRIWAGFDKWAAQQPEFCDSWTRNWKVGYDNQWIDYYLIQAKKA